MRLIVLEARMCTNFGKIWDLSIDPLETEGILRKFQKVM
jgi:hypothetical protein